MVTGAYAGNAASRHQMRGRLRRLGQKRKDKQGMSRHVSGRLDAALP